VHWADLTDGCGTESCFRRTNACTNSGAQLLVKAHKRAEFALYSVPGEDSLLHLGQTTQVVKVLRSVKNV
jgi:hypothetical protein